MPAVRTAIIEPALREIGVLAEGESANYHKANDAFAALNRLMDQWTTERLQLPFIRRSVWGMSANSGAYTFSATDAVSVTVNDGFDDEWVDDLPPNWEINAAGDRSAVAEGSGAAVSSGRTAVAMIESVAGTTIIHRDFPAVRPNQRALLSIFLKSNAGGACIVRVQNPGTGNYLNSAGTWQAAVTTCLTDTGAYAQFTRDFSMESSIDARLRIMLTTAINSASAFFDTMALTTFGSGAILIPRPVFIDHVSYIDSALGTEYEIPLTRFTDAAWQALPNKEMTATHPTHWYYSPQSPEGVLQFWPIPTSSTLRGVIYVPAEVSQFPSLDADVIVPPGYQRMFVKHLALELCPSYEREPTAMLVRQAANAMRVVKTANHKPREMSFDAGSLIGSASGGFDYRTGQ